MDSCLLKLHAKYIARSCFSTLDVDHYKNKQMNLKRKLTETMEIGIKFIHLSMFSKHFQAFVLPRRMPINEYCMVIMTL